jgi:hypothetical protein
MSAQGVLIALLMQMDRDRGKATNSRYNGGLKVYGLSYPRETLRQWRI